MRTIFGIVLAIVVISAAISCGGDSKVAKDVVDSGAVKDVPDVSGDHQGADSAPVEVVDVSGPEPVADIEAAARAFKLFYAERVDRTVVAYNRFQLFGDVTFGTTIGKVGISRKGDEWEIIGGPTDNNQIGESMWRAWNAYQVFRSRNLELTLMRMLEGLVFYEAVSGHPGLTARSVYPGWTRYVDGYAGTVERTRGGVAFSHPFPPSAALESEMIAAFFADGKFTYREDPEDMLLDYMTTAEMHDFMVTYSFSMLPNYLRVSDCCASLKRVPDEYPWGGAYFSNHNSRDNFPDLAMGFLVARAAMNDPESSEELRGVATRAWEAGKRVGDLVQEHGGRFMTVDEHNPYDKLIVAGAVRPDGETEQEDLGSISDCQMAFLARALSSEGLAVPLPELPAPGSVEFLLTPIVGEEECPLEKPVRLCRALNDGYCGKSWSNIGELKFLGKPWLKVIEELEAKTPGTAQGLIGSFQDDFHEKTIAALALVIHARQVGDEALLELAQSALAEITSLLRYFGKLVWERTNPASLAERYYRMGIYEVDGGLDAPLADFDSFTRAESQMARLEALLQVEEAPEKPLVTDEELKALADARLAKLTDAVRERYAEAYGDVPPLRRAGDGYEARIYHNGQLGPWYPVENQHHVTTGGFRFLESATLCVSAPHLLDCTWAKLGCARPDLNSDGKVDDADAALFNDGKTKAGAEPCSEGNSWCGGADLDRTGEVDSVDEAFMEAAQGCWY